MITIDLEVFSEVDITCNPIDVYATHPSTKIILACMAVDDGPVFDLENAEQTIQVLKAYRNHQLFAWNVGFERTVLAAQGFPTPISRWHDVMVHARYCGLPGSLKACAKVELMGVPAEKATKSETLLIKKFCTPYGKDHPGTPEEWKLFVDYCRRDVETTRHIHQQLQAYPFPDSERRVWEMDQVINERGLPIDVETCRHAASEVVRLTTEAGVKMRRLTGLDNPNSVQQLSGWLKDRGYAYNSLGKDFVEASLNA